MPLVTSEMWAQATKIQTSYTASAWLNRSDELARQQPILFFEILSFGRDGEKRELVKMLLDYLSILQAVATSLGKNYAEPISSENWRQAGRRMEEEEGEEGRGEGEICILSFS